MDRLLGEVDGPVKPEQASSYYTQTPNQGQTTQPEHWAFPRFVIPQPSFGVCVLDESN